MLKKVVIAGLAVAVGVAVLAWLSPKLISTIRYEAGQAVESAEDAVPLETEIGRLRGEVKRLEGDERHYYDQVAKQAVEKDKLAKDVDDTTAGLEAQRAYIEGMKKALGDDVRTSFHFKDRNLNREQALEQLGRDFKTYESVEKELQVKKELLSAAEKSLAASEDQLASLKSTRSEMDVELAKLEADLKLVRMKETQSNLKVDDNEYSQVRADIAKLRDRVSVKQKALDYEGKFGNGPADATASDNKTDAKDLLKRIDDKFNGDKPEGKSVVQDNNK